MRDDEGCTARAALAPRTWCRSARAVARILAASGSLLAGFASCRATDAHGPATTGEAGTVENGIDVLRRTGFAQLAGARVGLITNHTGLALDGTRTADLLHRAPNLELIALFSPEHGIAGRAEGEVGDAVDAATGLPIHSLYGPDRAPVAAQLVGIDTLVFDIQDVGCRFYTYLSTMGEAMRVAARCGLRFVVLDRPNPLGGLAWGGPMRDAGAGSFVAWHDLPLRHGMTLGELARLIDAELGLRGRLEVVAMQGWRRDMFLDATGQTWIDPSPNMRSPAQALLYPGVGMLEMTNVSVGRGTDTPFEVLGAPWIDGRALGRAVDEAGVPGLRCVPVRFEPRASVHAGSASGGVRFWVVDRAAFDPIRLGIVLACSLRRLHPGDWDTSRLDRLLANREVLDLIRRGATADEIMAVIARQQAAFGPRRLHHLIYP